MKVTRSNQISLILGPILLSILTATIFLLDFFQTGKIDIETRLLLLIPALLLTVTSYLHIEYYRACKNLRVDIEIDNSRFSIIQKEHSYYINFSDVEKIVIYAYTSTIKNISYGPPFSAYYFAIIRVKEELSIEDVVITSMMDRNLLDNLRMLHDIKLQYETVILPSISWETSIKD